jgi:hypothetical protein
LCGVVRLAEKLLSSFRSLLVDSNVLLHIVHVLASAELTVFYASLAGIVNGLTAKLTFLFQTLSACFVGSVVSDALLFFELIAGETPMLYLLVQGNLGLWGGIFQRRLGGIGLGV